MNDFDDDPLDLPEAGGDGVIETILLFKKRNESKPKRDMLYCFYGWSHYPVLDDEWLLDFNLRAL